MVTRSFLLLAIIALSATRTGAQNGRGDALIARIQTELDQLRLTDEQKGKTQQILTEARQKFRAMADELIQSEPAVRREKLDKFVQEIAEQIKPVLSEQQRGEFETRMERMRLQARPGAAASQPAGMAPQQENAQGPGAPNRPGLIFERLRDAVDSLDLSDEQRGLVSQLFADTRAKFQEIRAAGGDMPAMREKLLPVLQDTREKLMKVLNDKQKAKLLELMSTDSPGPQGRQRPGMMRPEMREEPANPTTAPIAEAPEIPAGAAIGQVAPMFTLKKLDGQNVELSSYKGKIVLLIFGSYTSPSFRQRVTALERIKREYGTRINPIIVYTAENHPVGKWEVQRNKDEGISVEAHKDMDARIAAARKARDAMKITVPIVIDSMDDATAGAYGGTTNAAILIGRDGTILARQRWFEPYALKQEIDSAVK
jgi:hypothetical protein